MLCTIHFRTKDVKNKKEKSSEFFMHVKGLLRYSFFILSINISIFEGRVIMRPNGRVGKSKRVYAQTFVIYLSL